MKQGAAATFAGNPLAVAGDCACARPVVGSYACARPVAAAALVCGSGALANDGGGELLRRKVPTWQVDSSFRSAQIFCSCPMNYSHAIYKGKVADELL